MKFRRPRAILDDMMDKIIEHLQTIFTQKGELNVLSEYKGLSISSPVVILKVENNGIEIEIDRFLAVSMAAEKFAFLQSNLLPEIVRAEVARMDLPQQRARLTNFKYAENRTSKREIVRVKPKDEVSSEVKDKLYQRSVRAELADISQTGIAIYVPKYDFRSWQFAMDAPMTVTLHLPGEYTLPIKKTGALPSREPMDRFERGSVRFNPIDHRTSEAPTSGPTHLTNPEIQVHATVKNVRMEPQRQRYRVGMQIDRSDASRTLIAQFISQRQSEIIRDIREMYDLLIKDAKP